MSVPVPERDPSDMEFVHNARQLQLYALSVCPNLPKRYTFYVNTKLYNYCEMIHDYVKTGNSITPTNQHEAQIRLDQFLMAKAKSHSLVSQIEVASEKLPINKKEWMSYVYKEIKLLNGVIKSDRARYRRLP